MILANLAEFIKSLYHADQVFFKKAKDGGCLHCRSPLDTSNYHRKIRGVPSDLEPEMTLKFSLCCRKSGCRKRHTPRSLRFYGAKVYWFYVIILSVLGVAVDWIAVPPQTIARWEALFITRLPPTKYWQGCRARFMPLLEEKNLLSSLVAAFACRDDPKNWFNLFEFLQPSCNELVGESIK